MSARRTEVLLLRDARAVADIACSEILRLANEAILVRGAFHIALAGGDTPRAAYTRLSRAGWLTDFERWHVWFGDERCVPPTDAQSNFGMARATLLSHAEIPPAQVHRMRGEASDPDEAAREYELELRAALGTPPRLDVVLLGLGADGHTASLFPRAAELLERERTVVAARAPASGPARITLTLPAIDAARRAVFLVAGNEKAAVLDAVLSLERPMPQLPASLVHLRDGATLWLVDRAAASKIGS